MCCDLSWQVDELCDNEIEWIQPTIVPSCLSSHLTTFIFRDYEGTNEELELIRYILKSGKVLKRTTIYFGSSWEPSEASDAVTELYSLPRASKDNMIMCFEAVWMVWTTSFSIFRYLTNLSLCRLDACVCEFSYIFIHLDRDVLWSLDLARLWIFVEIATGTTKKSVLLWDRLFMVRLLECN